MCECAFDNPPSFYDSRLVVARKSHLCCECLRTINRGEKYQYVRGLWEGDFSTFHTCSTCVAMVAEIALDCYCHGYIMDEIDERDYPDNQSVALFVSRRRDNYSSLRAGVST